MGRDRLNLLTREAEGRRVLHLLLVHFRPELLGDGGHRLALPHLFIRTHTHDRCSATCQRLNVLNVSNVVLFNCLFKCLNVLA